MALIQTLLKIILRSTVLNRLESFLIGWVSGSPKGKGTSTAGNASGTGVPALAGGGPMTAGQLSLVGEHGPELFRPTVPGTIIPNYKLRAAMGGGAPSLTFNFNIESTDGPGVEAALDRRLPEMVYMATEAAKQVVGANLSRPTPLRSRLRRG